MGKWIIETEYIAALLIAVIYVYTYLDRKVSLPRNIQFRRVVLIAFLSVLSSILSVYFIVHAKEFPLFLNHIVQIVFFTFTSVSAMGIFCYTVIIIYDNLNRQPERDIVLKAYYIITFVFVVLVFLNPWLKTFYYFDNDYNYIRGDYSYMSYFLYLVYIGLLSAVCMYLKDAIDSTFKRMALIGIPTSFFLVLMQYLNPDAIYFGTAVAFALLIVFITLQQSQMNVDILTGVGKRAVFTYTVQQLVLQKISFRIIIIGVDEVKTVNSRYGSNVGDRLFKKITSSLLELLKTSMVYRIRSTSFALIVLEEDEEKYREFLEKIITLFTNDWDLVEYQISMSYKTVDLFHESGKETFSELMDNFENMVELSKMLKGENYIQFNDSMKEASKRKEFIVELVRFSIRAKRFKIVFQPIYNCNANDFLGCEVLLRLNDYSGKAISPSEFIEVAEQYNLISDVGWIVIEKVCQFLVKNQTFDKYITINIAPQHFLKNDFLHRFFEMLDTYQINYHQIKLEITERFLLWDFDLTMSYLRALNRRGIGVLLDDFGSGYSNMFMINKFCLECIKFDGSLITDVVSSEKTQIILKAFIDGIRQSGSKVLIEGVETEEQAQLLKSMGVDYIQGYYYARPLKEDDLLKFLKKTSVS